MKRDDRLEQYESTLKVEYGFEKTLVHYRHKFLAEMIARLGFDSVLEVGCGPELLVQRVAHPFRRWLILEPVSTFLTHAKLLAEKDQRIETLEGFFEDGQRELEEWARRSPTLVLLSGLLHEVEDPERFVRLARKLAGENGIVHVNVPNASSMHRHLGKAMGLVKEIGESSDKNRAFRQPRVFSMAKLHALLEAGGLTVTESGGYFMKPFTHDQMLAIEPSINPVVFDGLYNLGRELPEYATEIYVNARPTH